MKLIAESNRDGWVNFGTVDQAYVRPYKIFVGDTGKVYRVDHNGKRTVEKSRENFKDTGKGFIPKNMTEEEAREWYNCEGDDYTYYPEA